MYQKIQNVQKKIGKIAKSKENPFFKSGYFDINMLLEKLQPILEEEGLVLIQPLNTIDGKPALTTMLVNLEDGKVIQTDIVLPETPDAQKMGSAITYVRRYAITSLFCLIGEDDDGNQASGKKVQKAIPEIQL